MAFIPGIYFIGFGVSQCNRSTLEYLKLKGDKIIAIPNMMEIYNQGDSMSFVIRYIKIQPVTISATFIA
jgi:hypothetical protein